MGRYMLGKKVLEEMAYELQNLVPSSLHSSLGRIFEKYGFKLIDNRWIFKGHDYFGQYREEST